MVLVHSAVDGKKESNLFLKHPTQQQHMLTVKDSQVGYEGGNSMGKRCCIDDFWIFLILLLVLVLVVALLL